MIWWEFHTMQLEVEFPAPIQPTALERSGMSCGTRRTGEATAVPRSVAELLAAAGVADDGKELLKLVMRASTSSSSKTSNVLPEGPCLPERLGPLPEKEL